MNDIESIKKVAAFDCGTNTIRLLIANQITHLNGTKTLEYLHPKWSNMNQLGIGVDSTHMFDEAALELTFKYEKEYAAFLREYNVPNENLKFIATSASRDAQNHDLFFEKTLDILGVKPTVISGETEASFSYLGATYCSNGSKSTGVDSPIAGIDLHNLVIDLGGGSTEFVKGKNLDLIDSFSADMGSVRLTEKYFSGVLIGEHIPLSAINDAEIEVKEWIKKVTSKIDLSDINNIYGLAGTITSITAYALRLEKYDPEIVGNAQLSFDEIYEACNLLIGSTESELYDQTILLPKRVPVIRAGALIFKTIISELSKIVKTDNIIVSENDILDGIALSI
ncbi:MAG: hypothetical protein LBN03_02745 [Bifidobacteriaceae bacterium]|nr:hypothetical protein [Bifidobacteriaceae bacterium]